MREHTSSTNIFRLLQCQGAFFLISMGTASLTRRMDFPWCASVDVEGLQCALYFKIISSTYQKYHQTQIYKIFGKLLTLPGFRLNRKIPHLPVPYHLQIWRVWKKYYLNKLREWCDKFTYFRGGCSIDESDTTMTKRLGREIALLKS